MTKALICFCALELLWLVNAGAPPKWTVHEWGTFTSLQNESGEAIGGINTDDEPVPQFVHRLANSLRLSQNLVLLPTEVPIIFFQGAPKCHPDVTMRLETPVIYFHPPESAKGVQTVNVAVKFRGGWLTEFYPDAKPEVSGAENDKFQFAHLGSETISGLAWNDLKIGGDWPLTNTTEHVWTSPRAVNAASVQSSNGESEKFLFYRGVGHLDAPLRVSREGAELVLRSQLGELPDDQPLNVRSIWLVDIQPNGNLAFRSLPPVALGRDHGKILTRTPARFSGRDFSKGNLEKLKNELRATLISEGLFTDEADALLNTWESSYFKSAGLRVFFIVPPAWTDFYLPLDISVAADINRVMVGRIELVTPDQRTRLKELATFSPDQIDKDIGTLRSSFYAGLIDAKSTNVTAAWTEIQRGRKPLASRVSVPKTYRTYLDLGRFRNALILDEATRSESTGLTNFIAKYRLQAGAPEKF
jgi:hypothetical protein